MPDNRRSKHGKQKAEDQEATRMPGSTDRKIPAEEELGRIAASKLRGGPRRSGNAEDRRRSDRVAAARIALDQCRTLGLPRGCR